MKAVTESKYIAYLSNDDFDSNAWRVKAGLSGVAGTYSFESAIIPGYYLSIDEDGHQVVVTKSDDSDKFKENSSWKTILGLANLGGFALESVGKPGFVLKYDLESLYSTKRIYQLVVKAKSEIQASN